MQPPTPRAAAGSFTLPSHPLLLRTTQAAPRKAGCRHAHPCKAQNISKELGHPPGSTQKKPTQQHNMAAAGEWPANQGATSSKPCALRDRNTNHCCLLCTALLTCSLLACFAMQHQPADLFASQALQPSSWLSTGCCLQSASFHCSLLRCQLLHARPSPMVPHSCLCAHWAGPAYVQHHTHNSSLLLAGSAADQG